MNARVQRRMRLLSNLAADERAPEGERAAARARLAALRAKHPEATPRVTAQNVRVTVGFADLDDDVNGVFVASGTTANGARWTMRATRPPRSR